MYCAGNKLQISVTSEKARTFLCSKRSWQQTTEWMMAFFMAGRINIGPNAFATHIPLTYGIQLILVT